MSIQGKTIIFTGKISKPRHEFQALVEEHGGIAGSDISKNTDYLVIGEKPGSKLARATMLGIKIITEEEFLKLLSPSEEEEIPPTPEELINLENHMAILECSFCHNTYKQWDVLPNYETCPVCEILSYPLCPHCNNEPIFVTDFKLYTCITCGIWFKAPFSTHRRQIEHLHYWYRYLQTPKGEVKECPCGSTLTIPDDYPEHPIVKYEPLYIKEKTRKCVQKWKAEEEKRWGEEQKEQLRGEKEVLNFLKTLSQDQLMGVLNATKAP